MIISRFLLIVSILIISPPILAEICRWVDSDGTVHYADECPEEVERSEVRLDPEPTPEQVEAAEDLARQRQLAKQSRRDSQKELSPQPPDESANEVKICIDAELALNTLERALPVYFDEAGVLHHNRSQHSQAYQGDRRYLDDSERRQELARARELVTQYCEESKSDIILQSDELSSRIKERMCADYEAEAERMIRSRESGSAERARRLIEYCESGQGRQ